MGLRKVVALRLISVTSLIAILSVNAEDDVFAFGSRPASVDYDHNTTQTLISSRTLILNLDDFAPRDGYLKSWSFCFFILNSEEISDDVINVGVWRPMNDTYKYSLVEGSLSELPMSQYYHGFDFACLKHSVPSDPIKVFEGDVVGAIVTAIPALFSIVGSDKANQIWTCPLPNNNNDVDCINLPTVIPNYGLYLEGLGVDVEYSLLDDSNISEGIRPLWVVYVITFLALFLVLTLCIVFFLLNALNRSRRKASQNIVLNRGDDHFSSDTHALKLDSRNGPTVSHDSSVSEEGLHRSTVVILENVNADDRTSERSPISVRSENPSPLAKHSSSVSSLNHGNFHTPRSPRSETFSFPPPSMRAPSPPQCGDQGSSVPSSNHANPVNTTSSYQLKMLRKTQSNPLHSSSSLPNLLSDETVYETVSRKPDRKAGRFHTATNDVRETEMAASGVLHVQDAEGATRPYANPKTAAEQRELGTPKQTSSHAKTRVSRLASAPLSLQDFDEPPDGEMRARFYSYRGMRLPSLTSRVGALKKPMPLPSMDDSTEQPPDPQCSENVEKSERSFILDSNRISERRQSELESTLDSIEEIDEHESHESSQTVPETYMEPVLLKSKGGKS